MFGIGEKMKNGYEFNVELDGGQIERVTTRSSFYRDVAAALPALLAKSLPFDATIWHDGSPKTKMSFRITENELGQLFVITLTRR